MNAFIVIGHAAGIGYYYFMMKREGGSVRICMLAEMVMVPCTIGLGSMSSYNTRESVLSPTSYIRYITYLLNV